MFSDDIFEQGMQDYLKDKIVRLEIKGRLGKDVFTDPSVQITPRDWCRWLIPVGEEIKP